MKTIRCLVVSALVAGLVPLTTLAGDSPEKMVVAAKALDEAFVAAFNAHDADALAALYWNSEDVVSFSPGTMETRGWEAIKKGFEQTFEASPFMKLELLESHHIVAAHVVITWGKWKTLTPGPDGQPVETIGRFTDLKSNPDGTWVYIHDHISVPIAPPPPAAPDGLESGT